MSPPDLSIRPVAPGDLDRLQEIRAAAFAPVFASFRALLGAALAEVAFAHAEDEQGDMLRAACAPDAPGAVLVAERQGRVIGFVRLSLDPDKRLGEIGLNAVHPDHAGQGVGTALYTAALTRMREAGMAAAMVGTGGDESHAPARRAYRKAGFDAAVPGFWMYRRL